MFKVDLFRKVRGTRDEISNIRRIIEKENSRKNIYFCYIDYAKAFVCITTNWKILQEIGIPDHLTCLLINLYAGQEAKIRTTHRTKLGKEYIKAVYCHCVYLTYMQSTS